MVPATLQNGSSKKPAFVKHVTTSLRFPSRSHRGQHSSAVTPSKNGHWLVSRVPPGCPSRRAAEWLGRPTTASRPPPTRSPRWGARFVSLDSVAAARAGVSMREPLGPVSCVCHGGGHTACSPSSSPLPRSPHLACAAPFFPLPNRPAARRRPCRRPPPPQFCAAMRTAAAAPSAPAQPRQTALYAPCVLMKGAHAAGARPGGSCLPRNWRARRSPPPLPPSQASPPPRGPPDRQKERETGDCWLSWLSWRRYRGGGGARATPMGGTRRCAATGNHRRGGGSARPGLEGGGGHQPIRAAAAPTPAPLPLAGYVRDESAAVATASRLGP